MNRSRSLYHLTLNWIHFTIIVVVTLIFTALLTASLTMFVYSHKTEEQYRQQRLEAEAVRTQMINFKNDYHQIENSDSNQTEIIKNLELRLQHLEDAQDNVLGDLRQESNNIINKANGWLAFWIAILAIFCGIMPIVIQYVLTNKTRREFDKIIDDLDKKAHSHHLFNLITSLHINKECSIIRDSSRQKDFISSIVNEAYQSTNHLIDKIDNGDGTLDRKGEMAIVSVLVQYCRLIELLKALSANRSIRDLDKIEILIKSLIKDILDHENINRQKVWARLLDLLPKLSELHVYN